MWVPLLWEVVKIMKTQVSQKKYEVVVEEEIKEILGEIETKKGE